VEAVAWEIASRLAQRGIADITWHSSDTDPAPRDRRGLHCVPAGTCNFAERRLGFPFPLWSPASLASLVRSVRKADVVHLHDFLYLSNIVAWAAARLWQRPVVVTQHVGMIPYRSVLMRVALTAANRILGKLVLGSAARTLFVSSAVLDYFRAFVRFGAPPSHLPNGVDTAIFAPADDDRRRALRAGLGARPQAPVLLFAGRFVEKKGLPLLRRLAERLPDACWIFAGWGPLDPSGWGLPNVSVRHSMTKEELVPLYQAADLLVLPSYGEGFPLVVQESMACGTPALVGEETAAGCPEALPFLLREPLQPGADAARRWSERIAALCASPEALRGLRPGVAAFARAAWSWDLCVERYAEALQASARS
jgi:glycosyltransferase involved in cell wall biosynthesis